ncbi:MAG: VC1465 family Xer recombination activation factor [Methylophilaceae bacterium]|nr:VC1465 family Xer recombination activation factor [Methylophilaceae bacterium]
MRKAKKLRRYIAPDDFYVARRRAGLTVSAAADMLDLNPRTIRNWESGKSRIPYSAFRLMRMTAGYALLGKQWEGWTVWRGKLYTPGGRSFEPHELLYVSTYIGLARHYLQSGYGVKPHADQRQGQTKAVGREKRSWMTLGRLTRLVSGVKGVRGWSFWRECGFHATACGRTLPKIDPSSCYPSPTGNTGGKAIQDSIVGKAQE